MGNDRSVLDQIRIASPCSASWDAMEGGDRVRFCAHCQKNVYNLSDMTRREAEKLVRDQEGRLCVRFYLRRDGTILTDDCPVGLRAVRRRLAMHLSSTAALLGGLLALSVRQTPLSHFAGLRAFADRVAIPSQPVLRLGEALPVPNPAPMGQLIPLSNGTMMGSPAPLPEHAVMGRRAPVPHPVTMGKVGVSLKMKPTPLSVGKHRRYTRHR